MNDESRRIKDSPIYQGASEQIAYTLTTTPWASSPTSPVLTIKDTDGVDVTSTYTSGSASVSGDVITLPTILNLVADTQYWMEVKFTVNGNVEATWADLRGEA